ncbi:MAG: hypothetical protein N2380_10735 [bacterium]|nr:hypothetical protein [bacterium]
MTNSILYIIKVYVLVLALSGIAFLVKLDRHYTLGLLLGSSLVLLNISLLSISFRRGIPSYPKAIVYMLLRILLLGLVILSMFICGIINKLNIIGVIIALLIYPLALIIGGIKVLRWKK